MLAAVTTFVVPLPPVSAKNSALMLAMYRLKYRIYLHAILPTEQACFSSETNDGVAKLSTLVHRQTRALRNLCY